MAPDGIPEGGSYLGVIPAAIRITSHCIALLSHNAVNSRWVKREVAKAISNNKKLDGILLDDFKVEDLEHTELELQFECVQIKYHLDDIVKNPSLINSFSQF